MNTGFSENPALPFGASQRWQLVYGWAYPYYGYQSVLATVLVSHLFTAQKIPTELSPVPKEHAKQFRW